MAFFASVTICDAQLTGCKNIAPAVKTGAYEVEIPDRGICLEAAVPVRDDLITAGIRAHYFNARTEHNPYPVTFVGEMEGPFEWITEFRYLSQAPDAPSLWRRLPKDCMPDPRPAALGIAPVNVLLLYG